MPINKNDTHVLREVVYKTILRQSRCRHWYLNQLKLTTNPKGLFYSEEAVRSLPVDASSAPHL
jgi:hypothetical protein